MFLRRLKKSKSLRIVNLLGLSVIFSSLLLSYAYIKKELSYDRFHANADRIVRYSVQVDNELIDGRYYGFSKSDPIVTEIPGIEDVAIIDRVYTAVLKSNGKRQVVNDFFFASANFFEVFNFNLLEGHKNSVLDAPEKAVISKRYAQELFGQESPVGKEILLSGRKFDAKTVFISGVFEDFPEASHFHSDLIVHRPDTENQDWAYVYLLLHNQADIKPVTEAITTHLKELTKDSPQKRSPYILPLTDIHLHSHVLRELDINGNINYLYLIAGANLLLLVIVFFNLWLNTGLIFSFNRRYYQLLRLNGASSPVVIRDECLLALALGVCAILFGGIIAYYLFPDLHLLSILRNSEIISLCLFFLILVIVVSSIPVITGMSSTLFLNTEKDLRTSGFRLSQVKYMLIAQYFMVILIVIISFGISKQIDLIKSSQVGGKENTILVMKEQPEEVKERFEVLKAELLKHPEIKLISSAMQLPGSAIRDMIGVWREDESEDDVRSLPIMIVGDDFLPFFNIQPIAGTVFSPNPRTFKDEREVFIKYKEEGVQSNLTEEYVINRKAALALGFDSPEEAIGKTIHIGYGIIAYIGKGVITGVTEDFNYTTMFEDSAPLILIQRNYFSQCFMVHLSPDQKKEALKTFNRVWGDVYPDYPADYTFLNNLYGQIYHNEFNAETLVHLFSVLCLIIANLGLIIIMAFVIKRKTKEIGIRKVNGATPANIIRMLNSSFVIWIGVAFLFAVPGAYLIMKSWLENFAYKTSLDCWMFIFAGLSVLSLSVILISWQSWRAATLNPVKAIKTE